MAKPSRASKKSASRRSNSEVIGEGKIQVGRLARAHRDDTPEAKEQRRRAPKTHPNQRITGGARKDEATKAKAEAPRQSAEMQSSSRTTRS